MDRQLPPNLQAIEKAIRLAGSQSQLARQIGTSQATVWKWLNKGLAVSAKLAVRIEDETQGQVSSHDLRPDLFRREPGDDHAAPVDLEPAR